MFRRLCQLSALAILGALLVFAPELLTAVSAPYRVQVRDRVLLRVVVCSQDEKSVSALYDALEGFRTANPAVHLRINRADEAQLLALAEPLPDVYVYPPQADLDEEGLFLPLDAPGDGERGAGEGVRRAASFAPREGEALLCAVSTASREQTTARALVDFLACFPLPIGVQ